MSGTKAGSAKMLATINKKYGVDEQGKSLFFKRIGHIGGQRGHTGGFYVNRELASKVGRAGGLKSRRGAKIPVRIEKTILKAEVEFRKMPWWERWFT